MADKFNFNGSTKIIDIVNDVYDFDVKQDLYGEWKRWMTVSDNSKYDEALRTVAGNPISDTLSIAPYYFLINGWRIRPWSGEYELTVNGNLYTDPTSASLTITPSGDTSIILRLETSANAQLVNGGISTEQDATLTRIDTNVVQLQTDFATTAVYVTEIRNDVKRLLGLLHENIYIDNPVFDTDGNLVGSRVRIYTTADDVGTDDNVLATYQVVSNGNGLGKFTYWQQKLADWHYPQYVDNQVGTHSGTADSLKTYNDGTEITCEETIGTPGFETDFRFLNVPVQSSYTVDINYKYNPGNAGHNKKLQAYNYTTAVWDDVTAANDDFPYVADYDLVNFTLSNGSDYNSNGQMKFKIIHSSPGNASHIFRTEYFKIT